MSIERLLATIRLTRSILVDESEIWLASPIAHDTARELQRGLRKHKKGVRLLLTWSEISTCPNPGLHRQYWCFTGKGRFVCEACAQIAV